MALYGRFAEYYDSIYQFVDYDKQCYILENIFLNLYLKKPKSILDIGCGTGSHSIILSKRGYDITGIDISKAMIEKAK